MLVVVPVGFDDPFSCSAIRCTSAAPAIAIGITKWREKNRLSVG